MPEAKSEPSENLLLHTKPAVHVYTVYTKVGTFNLYFFSLVIKSLKQYGGFCLVLIGFITSFLLFSVFLRTPLLHLFCCL